jgi:hypothetical protein
MDDGERPYSEQHSAVRARHLFILKPAPAVANDLHQTKADFRLTVADAYWQFTAAESILSFIRHAQNRIAALQLDKYQGTAGCLKWCPAR